MLISYYKQRMSIDLQYAQAIQQTSLMPSMLISYYRQRMSIDLQYAQTIQQTSLMPLMLISYYRQQMSIALQCAQAIEILQQATTLSHIFSYLLHITYIKGRRGLFS
jgi:phosphate starvation-inducible membrane PsiE